MCAIMSECVGDGEGVETGKWERKETEGKRNRGKQGKRRREGWRAAGAHREGRGRLDVFREHVQEAAGTEKMESQMLFTFQTLYTLYLWAQFFRALSFFPVGGGSHNVSGTSKKMTPFIS